MRGTMTGKTVENISRDVITGDPYMPPGFVGVPVQIASKLVQRVVVTKRNLVELQARCRLGMNHTDGARVVERSRDGSRQFLRRMGGRRVQTTAKGRVVDARPEEEMDQGPPNNLTIEPGDVVEVNTQTGQWHTWNRQPSLGPASIQGRQSLRLRVGNTFRMNAGECGPYHADFDGDEMNLGKAQSTLACTEAKYLMGMERHSLSDQNGNNQLSLVHSGILGMFHLTAASTRLNRQDMMHYANQICMPHMGDKRIYDLPDPEDQKTGKLFEKRAQNLDDFVRKSLNRFLATLV